MQKIRAKSFRDWMKANYNKSELIAMVDRGLQIGFHDICTTYETNKLYDRFSLEIWEFMRQEAGSKDLLEYIAKALNGYGVDDEESFKNAMVWYVAEGIAWLLLNEDGGDQ